ncbi:unnamed protein product [Adineta steineri]|uniref:Uncharacterized protein n=1 Tax=Adineta steineri TaxID=433720 RepID=A0A814F6W5_9BILA|nr:unnamed protein product [Adineta steineri]CAF3774748.1 unnamed protein product [Adineta steineri]
MNNTVVLLALLIVCVGTANSLECYFCGDTPANACPFPFHSGKPYVRTAYSSTGYCAKKSATAIPGDRASRGPAEPGLCNGGSGCRYTSPGVYTCCCWSNLCNTGTITSKSTITILFGALTLLLFNRYV